jgi:hypothetical protein
VAGLGCQRVKVSQILGSISSSARKILNGDFIVLYKWYSTRIPPDHVMIHCSKQKKSKSNLTEVNLLKNSKSLL